MHLITHQEDTCPGLYWPQSRQSNRPQRSRRHRAQVNDIYRNIITDNVTLTSNLQLQMMIPGNGPFRGSLHASLRVGPSESTSSTVEVRCDP
jgi:hypothetical protein